MYPTETDLHNHPPMTCPRITMEGDEVAKVRYQGVSHVGTRGKDAARRRARRMDRLGCIIGDW